MSIRVYEYGLRAPTLGADIVAEQMKLGHRYRNKLVEIERQRRERIRVIMASHPDAAPLEAELADLVTQRATARDAIKAVRKAARRRAESAEQRESARALTDRIRALRDQIKQIRSAVVAACQSQIDTVDEERLASIKKARHDCGVYWGTYLLHEASADQARKSRTPPHFVSWRGEGRVGVQLQKGLPLDELWGGDSRLQIVPVDAKAFDPTTRRGDRRRLHRTTLRMRVGSDGRSPIWAEWPMFYHRPLPEGASIKYAVVSRRRRNCQQWTWLLHLTVDLTACSETRPSPATGAVAFNLGFRKRDNGAVRSGYLVGDDGHEAEVLAAKSDLARGMTLTPEQRAAAQAWVTNGLGKASSIRSIRDRNLAEIQISLLAWLGRAGPRPDSLPTTPDLAGGMPDIAEPSGQAGGTPDTTPLDPAGGAPDLASVRAIPEWLADRAKYISMWKSQARFRSLAIAWESERFEGDAEIYETLRAWRERDDHLEMYEAGLRRSAIYDRRESYRIIAARAAARYATLVIDDTNIQDVVRSPPVESEHRGAHTPMRNIQRMAAPGELRMALINAFGKERTVVLPGGNKTRTCHRCSHVDEAWDRNENHDLVHACTGCGISWDEDANFCHNLLAAHRRGAEAIVADVKPSRHERLHAARRQRTSDEQAA